MVQVYMPVRSHIKKYVLNLLILIFCLLTSAAGFHFGTRVMMRRQVSFHFHKGMRMMMNPPSFERGESFEFGSGGGQDSNNIAHNKRGSQQSTSSGSCSEMVRLNPCYFDSRRGCQHSNSICPIDGRKCSADRSYLDNEYGPRNIIEEFSILDAMNDATSNENDENLNYKQFEITVEKNDNEQGDRLLYTYWGGDLSNNTKRDPDTPYGSHQELS